MQEHAKEYTVYIGTCGGYIDEISNVKKVCNQIKMYLIVQVRHVFKNISLWTKSERKGGISNSCVVIL